MRKRCIIAAIFAALVIGLCGCGNQVINPFDFGSYYYTVIHEVHSGTDIRITAWYEHENGIEVVLENGEHAWFTEGTYILFERTDAQGKCPICAKGE